MTEEQWAEAQRKDEETRFRIRDYFLAIDNQKIAEKNNKRTFAKKDVMNNGGQKNGK